MPFEFLWDKSTTSNDPSLVLPLLVAAVLIGLGVLLPTASLAGIIGGVLAIAVAASIASRSRASSMTAGSASA